MKGSECSAAKFEDLRKFRIRSLVVVAILRLPLPVELREPRARPDEAEDVDGTNSAILHIGRDFIVVQIGLTVTDVEVLQRRGGCLLYTSPSPRDGLLSRMPSSA